MAAIPPGLRPHQEEGLDILEECIEDPERCQGMVTHFCGTGKSRMIFELVRRHTEGSAVAPIPAPADGTSSLAIIVVPSIVLVTQFREGYLLKYGFQEQGQVLCVCCKDELRKIDQEGDRGLGGNDAAHKHDFETKAEPIGRWLKRRPGSRRLVLVTYASFPTFMAVVQEAQQKIGLCIFDEAHHVTSRTV